MNAKTMKVYKTLFALASQDYEANAEPLQRAVGELLPQSFDTAAELWEFIVTANDGGLSGVEMEKIAGANILAMFYAESPQRTYKVIAETAALRNLIYAYSQSAGSGAALNIVLYALSSNKLAAAEEMLRALVKNEDCGPMMKTITEHLFAGLAEKNGGKVTLGKKLSALLLAYAQKIKTPEKLVIIQRIKEVL